MIRSMTAFAANEAEFENLALSCELRSVNHRYLDISFKLPDRLRFAETELRALISAKINRGKVECSINLKKPNNRQHFTVDYDAVTALIATTNQIEQHMTAAFAYSALDVLAFPGIQQEAEPDRILLASTIGQLVAAAVAQLSDTRAREGQQLKLLLEERCAKIRDLIALGKKRVPEAHMALRQKLTDRITELNVQPDFDRLEQELVYLAQKLDIAEELDRLDTHISEVAQVLGRPEPVGKRLDFIMQELNREANTLGSKSTDKDLTQIAIELKVLIEQMREQVQNIE